ncbi:hypothetical protein [Spiroplasma culicicola]|uniref:Uncharacterized protein n=1 Tax=Spiroplasma culicicola AES-1 TaxID=1276246 RepID=W6A6A5_9MOLU|nr:hypothetical protein [Spiroplasma culicicola]AHI52486.1 hypothetical protein SCULI_v1c01450 [Spiroplasma culicicola AES-1]
MRTSSYALAITGTVFGLVIQILSAFLYVPIAKELGIYDERGFGFALTLFYILCNIIWLIFFAAFSLNKKKISKRFVGGIIGIAYSILVILASWVFVTWIFWILNFICAVIIIVASSFFIKDNRENL